MIRKNSKVEVLEVLSVEEIFQVEGGTINSGGVVSGSNGCVNVMETIIKWWNKE